MISVIWDSLHPGSKDLVDKLLDINQSCSSSLWQEAELQLRPASHSYINQNFHHLSKPTVVTLVPTWVDDISFNTKSYI